MSLIKPPPLCIPQLPCRLLPPAIELLKPGTLYCIALLCIALLCIVLICVALYYIELLKPKPGAPSDYLNLLSLAKCAVHLPAFPCVNYKEVQLCIGLIIKCHSYV